MQTKRRNRKNDLLEAAIRLVANGGPERATIRAIAREVGVSDAAVYRHYRSKEDLCSRAYARIAEEMIQGKREIVTSAMSFREKLRQWVQLTFAFFDRRPESFAFFLSTPHLKDPATGGLGSGQGNLFLEMVEQAMGGGDVRRMEPRLALCYFTGLMLNVPRMIREGTLSAPASAYVDEVAESAWRALKQRDGTDE